MTMGQVRTRGGRMSVKRYGYGLQAQPRRASECVEIWGVRQAGDDDFRSRALQRRPGAVSDVGTGVNSSVWSTRPPTEAWTG